MCAADKKIYETPVCKSRHTFYIMVYLSKNKKKIAFSCIIIYISSKPVNISNIIIRFGGILLSDEPKCPICGEYDEGDHFTCPKCGRDHICGKHYDFDFLVCEECAGSMDKAVKKTEVSKKFAKKVADAADGEDEEDSGKNPFYIRQVKCPVCGTAAEQRWFQAKIYSERNVDLDKHVGNYAWTEKAFEKYHPPLYYIWHCFNCHFAESYLEYENPAKDPFSNFRQLKDIFIDKYQDDPRVEKIVDKLGENIDYNKINYYQAIKLHLLAVFIQEMIEEEEDKDALKIGRYLLRLGWLYREMNANEEVAKKVKPTLEKLNAFLKKGWPEMPDSEESALKYAIDMLNLAFKTSHAIKSIVAEVDLLMLIAGIYLKMNDNENGLKYMNMVLSRGQKTKQRLDARIKEGEKAEKPMPADELRRLDVQLKKLDALMSRARDVMSDIQAERMKKEKEKALKIMKKLGERPPLEIREILLKKGIDKRVAVKLTPEPKKKFLGLF